MTDCRGKGIKTMRAKKKKVSHALSLCQEKGHTGNPIVSKSFLVEAQMQCLGTETRRNRMREGCRSHYAAWWCSQEKEAEKWQEESSHSLCLEEAGKWKAWLLPFSIPQQLPYSFSFAFSRGRIALQLCYMMERVFYEFFFRVITSQDKKPSSLSLPSSPPPTVLMVPLWVHVDKRTCAFCEVP